MKTKIKILLKIAKNKILIAWYEFNLKFPITFIMQLPGWMLVAIFVMIHLSIKGNLKSGYNDIVLIMNSLKTGQVTSDQIKMIQKLASWATHAAWWFWILMFLLILY